MFQFSCRFAAKLVTTCRHDCAMKYVTATRALMGGILKILNLSEILPVYLANRLYLSVATYRWQILQIWSSSEDHRR